MQRLQPNVLLVLFDCWVLFQSISILLLGRCGVMPKPGVPKGPDEPGENTMPDVDDVSGPVVK